MGIVFNFNKLLVLGFSRPDDVLKIKTILLRYQGQVHVMCLEAILRYKIILIQFPELKCRADALCQRKSQARDMLRLEEPITVQSLEET